MTRRRSVRPILAALLIAAPSVALSADWDPGRTFPPESVDDLKALQSQVRKVVDKTTAATVGVLVGMGAGSGVIVSPEGLVLTAAHVSGDPGKNVTLILPDGKRVSGKSLGINPKVDSGMIQITEKGPKDGKWPFVEVAKSGDLRRGQWVVSLGHPGGYKKDRTPVARLGRVQSTGRTVVRTDCTLVGGDSGGPLFDLDGRVVGIHSRIGPWLEQNIHVPSDAFKEEWDQLVRGDSIGKPSDAIIGVEFDEDAPNARVARTVEDGPSEKAGILAGDVITKFNGERVFNRDDVIQIIRRKRPGDEVALEVQRGDKTMELKVTLGKRIP